MTRIWPIFCLLIGYQSLAQCGYSTYSASLATNKDHCIGSSLIVSSLHALQKIIWYKDGVAVNTITGASSFTQTPKIVAGGHGPGPNNNQFYPIDVAVDPAGDLYVADDNADRVLKFTPGSSSGTVVAGGNGRGNGANQLAGVAGICLDNGGNLYIADNGNHRIQKWAPGASSGVTVAGQLGLGTGPDHLRDPQDVYLDCNGDMYIPDGASDRVLKWTPGAATGTVVIGQNSNYTLNDPLQYALRVAVDRAGNIYVGEGYEGGRVQKFAPGATTGTILGTTGFEPEGLWVDGAGNVFICGNSSDKVLEWTPGSTSWQTVISTNWKPHDTFIAPAYYGLAFDSKGNLYFGDEDYSADECLRYSSCDSAYTPTAPGIYTATVLDWNGDTAKTAPFVINTPFTGPPPAIGITATATSVPVCVPITFTATPVNPGVNAAYQWQVSGVNVGDGSLTYTNNLFANGDNVLCILNTDTGCSATPVSDTSNIINLTIDAQGHPTITITATDTAVCAGTPIVFTASVINAAANPGYDWLVNGVSIGDNANTYIDSIAAGGQAVYCLIASDASCGLAKSNTIPVTIYPLPTVVPNQVFNIPYGKREEIDPVITGDIQTYAWTPAAGLSDTTVRDPVANPTGTTTYILSVTSYGGCTAVGPITVNIYTPLGLPSAFTPNGDGHNDIFYILGGPAGSVIKQFAVFNRWGQPIFQVHDAAPGDPAYGWNGYFHGSPATAGTYVYIVEMQLPGGAHQVYKGTVVLIR